MNNCKKYLRLLLPVLFGFYLGNLIWYTYIHIVDGVTIVHSHPYKKSQGEPVDHEHSSSVLQLLNQFYQIEVAGVDVILLFEAVHTACIYDISIQPIYPEYLTPVERKLSLRAPPLV